MSVRTLPLISNAGHPAAFGAVRYRCAATTGVRPVAEVDRHCCRDARCAGPDRGGSLTTAAGSLVGITKRFDDVVAVDGVTLDVVDGEFFSLLGPSGSGKTTCLRMIAGFEAPTGGRGSAKPRPVAGRAAAGGGPGPGPDHPAPGDPPRRAARRPRPQTAPCHA